MVGGGAVGEVEVKGSFSIKTKQTSSLSLGAKGDGGGDGRRLEKEESDDVNGCLEFHSRMIEGEKHVELHRRQKNSHLFFVLVLVRN